MRAGARDSQHSASEPSCATPRDSRLIPPLDGIVAANAIHYTRDQVPLLEDWRGYLKPEGQLVVVEYDTDVGNRWVPYPLSFTTFGRMARAAGFTAPRLLGTRPSRFLGRFYAAVTSPASSADDRRRRRS